MEEIIALVSIALGLITALGVALGFSLKTRKGWLIILSGFICGFLMGFSKNLITGLSTGMIVVVLTIISGTAMLRINDQFKK